MLWAVENGITTGATSTTFDPSGLCTRAQVVTFLWRAAGQPDPQETQCPFTDVNPNAYYYKAVLWALEEGITTGMTRTEFAPNEACTRGQVVTFLWRAEGKPDAPAANPFADVSPTSYYARAVSWAVDQGVTNGISQTSFAPGDACTRAQIVTFLYRDLAE